MRIVGGTLRGRSLAGIGAGDPGAHLRPTSDRVRESLFNILTQGAEGDLVTDARVLDLFAGTGALGLEALSRGAASATFVDNGAKARALLRENVVRTGTAGSARIFRRDATRLGQSQDAPYTLVFLDPPYGTDLGVRALASARDGGWLAPRAVAVLETGEAQSPPDRTERIDARRYGTTHLTLLRVLG